MNLYTEQEWPSDIIVLLILAVIGAVLTILVLKRNARSAVIAVFPVFFLPIIIIEYMVLFWYWAGGSYFNLVAVPVLYLLYLLIHIFVLRRVSLGWVQRILIKYSLIMTTPVLTIATLYIIGKIANISVEVV